MANQSLPNTMPLPQLPGAIDPYSLRGGQQDIIRSLAQFMPQILQAIHAIQDDLTDIQGDITTIEGNITTIQSDISDIQDTLAARGHGALVRDTNNQSIPHATFTALTWDTEIYDDADIHSTLSDTSRLTVPAGASRVRLNGGVAFAPNGTGRRIIQLNKNGSSFVGNPRFDTLPPSAGALSIFSLASSVLQVSPGDYFELMAYQESGSPLNTVSSNHRFFAMEIVA